MSRLTSVLLSLLLLFVHTSVSYVDIILLLDYYRVTLELYACAIDDVIV